MDSIKNFLYMDTDYLNSYMSQIEDGKSIFKTDTLTSATTSGEKLIPSTEQYTVSGNTAGSALGIIKAEAKGEITHISDGLQREFVETEIGKEMVARIIHDNAFFGLYEYVQKNGILTSQSNVEVGSFISIKIPLNILDLNYIKSFLSDQFLELFKYFSKQEILAKKESATQNINREQKRDKSYNDQIRKIEQEANSQLETACDTIKTVSAMVDFLKEIMPSDTFFLNDKFIAPVNQIYLRESVKLINFKYACKEITIFGKVTKQIELKDFYANLDNDFLAIGSKMLPSIFDMLQIKIHKQFVISPIAIYV